MKITAVHPVLISSPYGDGNVLGQPLGVKTIGLVKIETDSGMIGWGEAYCGIYIPEIFSKVVKFISDDLIGKPVDDPIEMFHRYHIPFVSSSGVFRSVYSAIDIALWDLYAQDLKTPIHQLISACKRDAIPVYASAGSAAFDVSQIESDVDSLMKLGHKNYKMRVGFQSWENDLERVSKAHSMISDNGNLMVDAIMGTINPSWSLDTAIEKEKDLRCFDLKWLEEPLPPGNLSEYIALCQNSEIPVAAGEALTSKVEFESFIRDRAVDIIQPDVTHCGGISAAIEICRFAESHKLPIALHVWGSPISFLANLEIALSFSNVEWLEIPSVQLEVSDKIYTRASVRDGFISPEIKTGLQLAINNDLLSEYSFQPGSGFKFPAARQ